MSFRPAACLLAFAAAAAVPVVAFQPVARAAEDAPADSPDVAAARSAAVAFAKVLGGGDPAAIKAAFGGTAEDFALIEQTRTAMTAMAKFKAAVAKKFPEAAEKMGNDMSAEKLVARLGQVPAAAAGDEVTFGDTKVRKVGGQWKVVDLFASPTGKQFGPKMMAAMAKVADDLTPEVEAGKFKSAQELQQAAREKSRALMQAAMGAATRPAGK